MTIYAKSDKEILKEIGARVRRHRLRRNLTQEILAERTLLSVGTIKALEQGKGKLSTLVAVVRELGLLHELETFLEPPRVSPLELAERRKPRVRARGNATAQGKKQTSDW